MFKKSKKLISLQFFSILIIFSLLFSTNSLYAEQVSGKIIWVSPFFGFVYIRLDDQKIASLNSNLEVYLKANGKNGKINSITSYQDVTICKIEPLELVREIKKGDTVSGNIKLEQQHQKTKRLIDTDIIREFERKQIIEKEIEEEIVTSSSQLPPGSTAISVDVLKNQKIEEKYKEEKEKNRVQNLWEESKRKEEERKKNEEEEKKKYLHSLTAEQWIEKAKITADSRAKIDCFQNALTMKRDSAEAHYGLGLAYQETGRLDDALIEYIEVKKLEKGNANVLNNMADICNRLGLREQALEYINTALIINPLLTIAWVTLGEIYEAMGDKNKAIDAYSRAIDDPKWKSHVTKKIAELQR